MNQTAKTRKVFDGRYEILKIIGRGALSVVYHAKSLASPSDQTALKVLVDQKGQRPSAERLHREALAMVSCRHRYVVRLDDFHSIGSLCYLAMEFCPEGNLRSFVQKHGGNLPLQQTERFLKQTLEAVSFIHKAGILHRDIKPDNILILNDREIRLTDFGVALLPGEECSIADLQSGVGTMHYMAPEIIEGHTLDARSDLYSIGVVFFELLTGVNPFSDKPLADQVDSRHDSALPKILDLAPQTPPYLAKVIEKSMRFEISDRYLDADQMLRDLLDGRAAWFEARHTKPKRRNKRPHQSNKGLEALEENSSAHSDSFISVDTPEVKGSQSATMDSADQRQTIDSSASDSQSVFLENESDALLSGQTEAAQKPDESHLNFLAQEHDENHLTLESGKQDQEKDFSESATTAKKDEMKEKSKEDRAKPEEIRSFEHPNFKKTVTFDRHTVERIRSAAKEPQATPQPSKTSATTTDLLAPRTIKSDLKSSIVLAAIIIVFLGLLLPGVRARLSTAIHSVVGIDLSRSLSGFASSSSSPIPNATDAPLTFPLLPSGLYAGTINNLLPGTSLPITMISFAAQDKLAVFIGIDGWTPVILTPRRSQSGPSGQINPTLRVSSNGIILDLTAQNVEGELIGYYRNVVTGAQGEWRMRPAKKSE